MAGHEARRARALHLAIPELASHVEAEPAPTPLPHPLPHDTETSGAQNRPNPSEVHGRGVEPPRLAAAEPKDAEDIKETSAICVARGDGTPDTQIGDYLTIGDGSSIGQSVHILDALEVISIALQSATPELREEARKLLNAAFPDHLGAQRGRRERP